MPRISICLVAAAACAASPTLTAQEPLYVLRGKAPNAQYGSSVTSAGDVDKDGFPDLIVGAPIDRRTTEKSGAVEVRSGRTGKLLYTWLGQGPGDELGFGASGAGDVDADGFDDIIVGVLGGVGPERSFIGHTRVYSGRTGERLHTSKGKVYYDFYGLAVGGVGDIDGDGHDDFAIGCPGGDANGTNSGYLEVHSGRTGEVIYSFVGDAADDQFGWFVRSIGDLDGDGVPDMLVGAPGHRVEGRSGYARVFSGRTGEVLITVRGEHDGDRLGWSVARAGDIDGDGKPDLLVGAPFHDSAGPDSGAVYLFSGGTGDVLQKVVGLEPGALFGWCVTDAGDYDLDQVPDFWVGAKLEDASGEDSGAVHLVSARTGARILAIPGRSAGDEFGFSLVDLGPVLEGGDHELAVGARSDDLGNGEMVGSTSLYRVHPATVGTDGQAHVVAGDGEVESFDAATIVPSEDPDRRDPEGIPWLAIGSTAAALLAILALFRRGS